jgi:hypothetical protein
MSQDIKLRGVDRCDQCGDMVAYIDIGFRPSMQGMAHGGCGGAYQPAVIDINDAIEVLVASDSPTVRDAIEQALNSDEGQAALDGWEARQESNRA